LLIEQQQREPKQMHKIEFTLDAFAYDPDADTLSAAVSTVSDVAKTTFDIDLDFANNSARIYARDEFQANAAYPAKVLAAFADTLDDVLAADHTMSPAEACGMIATFEITNEVRRYTGL
jgi:hypothetical protein